MNKEELAWYHACIHPWCTESCRCTVLATEPYYIVSLKFNMNEQCIMC